MSPLHKQIFDKVRKGEVDEVVRLITEQNLDVSQIQDEAKNFNQSPMFAASVIPDKEVALRMIKALASVGVSPMKEDSLKQTPLFYAAREGFNQAIDYYCNERGDSVNRQDIYGQTPVYYACRDGHIKTVQFMMDMGANFDHADTKNQRPIYYAIKFNRFEMVKFLIDKGADLHMEDKKEMTPTMWAKRSNRTEILSLILERGGAPIKEGKNNANNRRPKAPAAQVPAAPAEPKPAPVNEKKTKRQYMLTMLREDGFYSPMTDAEFEQFRQSNPQIAKYFELDDNDEDMHSIDSLSVPEVPDSAPIFDQWEKAA